MFFYCKQLGLIVLISALFQNNFCACEDDFQTTVDRFMDAFDDAYAYSTEINSATTEEVLGSGNEIPVEVPLVAEEHVKDNEEREEAVTVQEDPVVTERAYQPGEDVRHELTAEVRALAERAVAAISPMLRLVNISEAVSTVTDKIQRSLTLVVSRMECEGQFCSVSCRVELTSQGNADEVTWHNCLDFPGTNEVIRDKRGAIGGFKQVDEEEAKELAEIAVQTLDSIDADDNKRVVIQVLKAQKQLVNGIMYHMTLEVALTDCKETDEKCEGKYVDQNICKILMQRLFSGDAPRNAQVIKSECTPISQVKETKNIKREKRHVTEDGSENSILTDTVIPTKKSYRASRKVGGKVTKDPNSDKIKEIAEFVLATLDKSSNSVYKQKVVRVVEAKSQVVSGVKYFLKLELMETNCKKGTTQEDCDMEAEEPSQTCEVTVWEREWEKLKTVTKVDCTPIQKRRKRALVGGKKDADPNNAQVQEMAKFAVSQLDGRSNSLNSQKLVTVTKAQTQTVAGTNYFLTLQMVETNCRKGSEVGDQCVAASEKVIQECDVVIYDRPWDKHREMTSADCTTAKKVAKRGVPGGLSDADPNDAQVQEMAKFAVSQLDASSNSLNSQKLVSVKKAQTQVVAGKNYFLKLQLIETNCKKGSEAGNQCDAAADKVIQECDVVVYDRPWDKHREMTSADCSTAKTVAKRGLPGGLSDADPNDAKVQEMAKFAVSQLDASSNSLNSQKLVSVTKAQTQVVAGTNYYLKLQLIETNCKKGSEVGNQCDAATDKVIQECDVVVYDRPWDKHREMTSANCSTAKKVAKRDVLLGGPTAQNKDSDDIKEIAHFAVEDMNKKSNALYKQTLVEVISAHTQVVSGLKYILKLRVAESDCLKDSADITTTCSPKADKVHQECDVEIWSQSWLKKQEVTKRECKPAQGQVSGDTKDKKTVRKREVLLGAHSLQDKDSDEVKEVAQFAVDDLNKKTNSMYKHALLEVLSAKKQVAAGINYHLRLRIAESNCKKSAKIQSQNCSPKEIGSSQECEITVWSRPWLKAREVTSSVCKKPLNKQATGGPKPIDAADPEVLEAAKYALKAIDSGSNSYFKHALFKVVDAKVQTVSGKKYFLTIEIGESECPKNDARENCPVRVENTLNNRCNAVVWNQPWLDKTEVLDFNCGIRSKRSVDGSASENDIHHNMFEEFRLKYNKVYSSDAEHYRRFRIFRANLKKIKAFQENEQGTAVYGANMFADLTAKEFKKQYLGLKPGTAPKPSKHHMLPAVIPDVDLPTDFDWRDHNVVTPVKNQGSCGSCWAFSVTGNIEGQWALKHGELLSFSEQELVDCDKKDSGCNGGEMTTAYEAIEQIGGLELEDEYPYDALDETCKFNSSEVKATVASSVNITTNETQIAQWLFANGPISIGLNANAMQFYMGGVSHPLKFLCSKDQLDHGVLLVGFGVHNYPLFHKSLPFWIIKNSWGPKWGEKGYYRLYRGDGTCGVNQMCSSAIVD